MLAECETTGASVAAIAQARGLNANLVHRWRRHQLSTRAAAVPAVVGEFMPLALPAAPRCKPESTEAPVHASQPDIRVELRRGATSATVIWPLAGAAECGAWLRE
ncbi:IS66 family insertion sequence element accessory protein TnpB [Variovorax paradoxus]|nr:IS66 family insertion sequence element accessory protein TnpB [Variovorax paradoxus]